MALADILSGILGSAGGAGGGTGSSSGLLSNILGGYSSSRMGDIASQGSQGVIDALTRGIERFEAAGQRGEGLYQPFVETGENTLQRLSDLLLGGDMSGFQASPGYQFRQDEAQKAVERSAAARGGLVSGRTLKELQERSQGLASQEYGNYMNRLSGLLGQTSGQFLSPSVQIPFQTAGEVVPLDIRRAQEMAAAAAASEAGGLGGIGGMLGSLSGGGSGSPLGMLGSIVGGAFGGPAGSVAGGRIGGMFGGMI